ncbi:MAG: hypothetical protein ACM3ZC_03000 [Bacteroidota bacterium]
MGKSKISRTDFDDSGSIGLTMFYISNEQYIKNQQFIDNVRKIGTSHKVNYYYSTSTDYPIGALYDIYNSPDITDKEEKTRAYNDFQKAKQMENNIVVMI